MRRCGRHSPRIQRWPPLARSALLPTWRPGLSPRQLGVIYLGPLLSIHSWALGRRERPLTFRRGRWNRDSQRYKDALSDAEKESRQEAGGATQAGFLRRCQCPPLVVLSDQVCMSSLPEPPCPPLPPVCSPQMLLHSERQLGTSISFFKVRFSLLGVQPGRGSLCAGAQSPGAGQLLTLWCERLWLLAFSLCHKEVSCPCLLPLCPGS